ncbi:MAG: 6-carboxytetrahydropterin synthase [Thermoguttaceae bacterium]
MSSFQIRIASDELTFSASHFMIFEDGQCERLHGHTYRVSTEVSGPLNAGGYVVDFLAVHEALKSILADLDHRTLLPMQHAALRVTCRGDVVEASLADRRWTFPADDCQLLPVANTTTELLAQHVGRCLRTALTALGVDSIERLRVTIDEGDGFSAICELR